jgi:methylase of polypeptide subunit release factors
MSTVRAPAVFAGPLNAADVPRIAEFRRVLDRHEFGGAGVPTALGAALPIGKFHYRDDLPVYLRRLAAPTPINTLIKLFVLDQPIDDALVRDAIAPLDLDDLRRLGLIEDDGESVRATVRLSGYAGLVLAHDRYDEQAGTLREDHVLDVNPTSVKLASLTVRRHARTALDIGTGCGVLALLAARHSDLVIATDTNPRALNMAAFNAALNGVENVEWRQGSLFEPVSGCRFDLLVCNPPYVISPDSRFLFRDGGRRGDAMSEEVVRRIPDYLEEGGFASVLCNWGLREDEDATAPLRRWVEGNGCDAWLLWSSTPDPLTYAAMWTRTRDRAAYELALDRWIAYFDELGVTAIGMGGVVLRRRSAESNWIRSDQLPDVPLGEGDVHIRRVFDSHDRLAVLSDTDVLDRAFRVALDHRLEQALAFQDGEYRITSGAVQLEGGLGFRGSVDPYTINMLARCDGRRRLADIATELAQKGGADREQIAGACATIARRLASLGFLIPVDDARTDQKEDS